MVIMVVVGPHGRGASRGPDDHGGGRSTWERSIKKNATVLEKKKSKLTAKERSYERKCVTHGMEKRGQGNEAASSRRRRTARHVVCEGKDTQNEYFQYI